MRTTMGGFKVCVLAIALSGGVATMPVLAADGAFDGLAGSWGGSGVVKYTDGSTEHMHCNARYSGGTSDVSLAINCASSAHNIDVSGRLHSTGGHVGGNWSESNLGLAGSATGKASPGHLSLGLGGGVSGSMSVSYTGSRQDVAISVDGVALQSVRMTMARR